MFRADQLALCRTFDQGTCLNLSDIVLERLASLSYLVALRASNCLPVPRRV
jgi:hypothetical protein